MKPDKPLGRKTYGSIGHLPSSRLGPGDWHVHEGQARIATVKTRDRHDRVYVQEKLDGSCCGVALLDDQIHALGRAGYLAQTSKFEMHQLFAYWVRENEERFRAVLNEGERIVGEWLAQVHGTIYNLGSADPFVAFDIMRDTQRAPTMEVYERAGAYFWTPHLIETEPVDPVALAGAVGNGFHGATEPCEGFVYRVERRGEVDFLAKWVRPDKIDGKYLPGAGDNPESAEPVWLWRPERNPIA